ncbi:FAD-binding protein, partial [Chloroflexota bacterium]
NTWGETSIAGLFAAGETASTGVHGANRLASNSMLEVVVFSKRIVEKARKETVTKPTARKQVGNTYSTLKERDTVKTTQPPSLTALQKLLWEKVGVIRDKKGLTRAADVLATWQKSLPVPTDRPSYELNNMVLNARLMTEAALLREESRGAHFRYDFPQSSPEWQRHIICTVNEKR